MVSRRLLAPRKWKTRRGPAIASAGRPGNRSQIRQSSRSRSRGSYQASDTRADSFHRHLFLPKSEIQNHAAGSKISADQLTSQRPDGQWWCRPIVSHTSCLMALYFYGTYARTVSVVVAARFNPKNSSCPRASRIAYMRLWLTRAGIECILVSILPYRQSRLSQVAICSSLSFSRASSRFRYSIDTIVLLYSTIGASKLGTGLPVGTRGLGLGR